MPTITIKNIPDILYEKVKKNAQRNHRSINSEVIHCIEQAVRSSKVDPDAFLLKIEALRKQIEAPPLTDDFLRQAKEEGRP